MCNPAPRRWHTWRVAPAARPTESAGAPTNRLTRPPSAAPEPPGPDGIRWALVARVRAEIAAGTYDTPEKWAAAEERLLRRAEGSV